MAMLRWLRALPLLTPELVRTLREVLNERAGGVPKRLAEDLPL